MAPVAPLARILLLTAVLAGCTTPAAGEDVPVGERSGLSADFTWTQGPEPAVERGDGACAVLGDQLLLVGGYVDTPTKIIGEALSTPSAEIFDLRSGRWSAAPDLPISTSHGQMASARERFYFLGGYMGPFWVPVSDAYSWAPGEAAWREEAPLPVARGAGGAAVVGDKIYLVGGVTTGAGTPADTHPELELTPRVDVFDAASGTWSRGPDLPTVRDHLAVSAVDGTVVAAGGRELDRAKNTDVVERLSGGTWSRGTSAPTERGGVAGSAFHGRLVLVGGESYQESFNEVEVYDLVADSWTTLPDLPTPRHGLCLATMRDGLHVVAGPHGPGLGWSTTHEVLVPASEARS